MKPFSNITDSINLHQLLINDNFDRCVDFEISYINSGTKASMATIFLNRGLSRPLFGFIFPIVSLQLIIDDRKEERRRKSMRCSIIRY